mmetsp:Transcript_6639/g.15055  ORF Transcript_6639/g.15055 Transcript_6639/m.15055 type:complete len:330 (-) Transcript_6639:329-1318(-)
MTRIQTKHILTSKQCVFPLRKILRLEMLRRFLHVRFGKTGDIVRKKTIPHHNAIEIIIGIDGFDNTAPFGDYMRIIADSRYIALGEGCFFGFGYDEIGIGSDLTGEIIKVSGMDDSLLDAVEREHGSAEFVGEPLSSLSGHKLCSALLLLNIRIPLRINRHHSHGTQYTKSQQAQYRNMRMFPNRFEKVSRFIPPRQSPSLHAVSTRLSFFLAILIIVIQLIVTVLIRIAALCIQSIPQSLGATSAHELGPNISTGRTRVRCTTGRAGRCNGEIVNVGMTAFMMTEGHAFGGPSPLVVVAVTIMVVGYPSLGSIINIIFRVLSAFGAIS